MTTKKDDEFWKLRRPKLEAQPDGTLRAVWPVHRYRFMLNDGTTLDVVSERDDSDLRGVVLEYTKAERIEGMARLPEPEEKPEPPKRRMKRAATPVSDRSS